MSEADPSSELASRIDMAPVGPVPLNDAKYGLKEQPGQFNSPVR